MELEQRRSVPVSFFGKGNLLSTVGYCSFVIWVMIWVKVSP